MLGEEAGARNLVFFRVKWLQPGDERFLVCAAVAAAVGLPFFDFACKGVRKATGLRNLYLGQRPGRRP